MEEQAKAPEKEESKDTKDTTQTENKEEESESKKRARDENEEELPASKRPKLSDDSASSSSDDISTHSSDADIDADENHENGENGKGETREQEEEEHKGVMVPASEEDASDDIEAASVLEEDAPSIHNEKEEVVKDVEGNVLPTKKSDDDTAASDSETPAKVTADQEQALAETELKFLEHSLNDTALLSVLSMLKNVHASYYASEKNDTSRDVKVHKIVYH